MIDKKPLVRKMSKLVKPSFIIVPKTTPYPHLSQVLGSFLGCYQAGSGRRRELAREIFTGIIITGFRGTQTLTCH